MQTSKKWAKIGDRLQSELAILIEMQEIELKNMTKVTELKRDLFKRILQTTMSEKNTRNTRFKDADFLPIHHQSINDDEKEASHKNDIEGMKLESKKLHEDLHEYQAGLANSCI